MALDLSNFIGNLPEQSSGKGALRPASNAGKSVDGNIESMVRAKADEYGIDPDVFVGLALRESGMNPGAKNPGSSAGGLFQFIDGTWKSYGKGDKFDPEANADAAARMFKENLSRFGGDTRLALAAHHVGPGKAERALTDSRVGDKDVSTQKWLSDIYKLSGIPEEKGGKGAFVSNAEPEVSSYEPVRQAMARQAASDESPISTSLKRGWNSMTDSVGNALDTAAGNSEGVAKRLEKARAFDQENPAPSANKQWEQDWQDSNTSGWLGNISGFVGNSAEQLANSLPSMVGSIPGAMAGGSIGSSFGPVGLLVGGVIGSFVGSVPGSVATETGSRIPEMMGKDGVDMNDPAAVRDWMTENRDKVLHEGVVKGLTTASFDGITGGIGQRIIAGPMLKFARHDVATLGKMGVDTADKTALAAARSTVTYKTAMQAPAAELKAATTVAQNAMRGSSAFAGEMIGEGGGEYYGEKMATGQGNLDEALKEALFAGGQSAATTAASFGYRSLIGADSDKKNIDALAAFNPPAAPPQVIKSNSPLSNAANSALNPAGVAAQRDHEAKTAAEDRQRSAESQIDPEKGLVVTNGVTDSQAPFIDDYSLTPKFNAIKSFISQPENIQSLRQMDPEMVGEALHVWNAVINNPDVNATTRKRALEQMYGMAQNLPNFTMQEQQQPQAPQPGLLGAPEQQNGMQQSAQNSTDVGQLDLSLGSIPGESTRIAGELPSGTAALAEPAGQISGPVAEQAPTEAIPATQTAAPDTEAPLQAAKAEMQKRFRFDQLKDLVSKGFDKIVDGHLVNTKTGHREPIAGPAEMLVARNAIRAKIDAAAHTAATSPQNDKAEPTQAQADAGKYAKGHIVNFHGFNISIENPDGSTRRGVSPDGVKWESVMHGHYGYFKGIIGYDKDHLDINIGPRPDLDTFYVIDQRDPKSGHFDEHKVYAGQRSIVDSNKAYHSNYEQGWDGMQDITPLSLTEFKEWVADGGPKQGPVTVWVDARNEAAKPEFEEAKRDEAPAAQEPIKNEAAAAASDSADTGDQNQEPIKNQSEQPLDMVNAPLSEDDLSAMFDDAAAELEAEKATEQEEESSQTANSELAAGEALPNATAPEHVSTGVDDRELDQIVEEFNAAQQSMVESGDRVSHVFDAPAKSDVVRLADKVRVYHAKHGWMTPDIARAKINEWKEHTRSQYDNKDTRTANSQRVVLSLFDLSGKWSQPWEEAGYQVYRFDIQADPQVGDVNNFSTDFFNDWFGDFEGQDIYAILAATPCTDFASSGARHFAAKDKDGRTVASVNLVHQTLRTIEYFKPAVWALENPVGRIEKLGGLPPWRLSFDPNHVGEDYTKKTLIWGRFDGNMPIAPTEPTEGSKMHRLYGGKSMATKNARSETPEGFAYSFFMANNAVDNPVLAVAGKYDRLDRALIQKALDAGVTAEEIDNAVEDFYYMDMDDKAANEAIAALIPEGTAPESTKKIEEPKGWRKSYGTASKFAESLGVALRGADGKLKKLAPLVADIEAKLAGGESAQNATDSANIDAQNDADSAKMLSVDEQIAPAVAENKADSGDSDFERGKAMMGEGMDALIALLGGKTNMLPEEEAQIIPVMSKIFRGAALMGYAKFKEAAKFVIDTLRDKAPDVAAKIEMKNLQAAYINLNGFEAAKEIGEFETIEALMAASQKADEPFEAAGYRIYPTTVNVGGKSEDMWGVQSEDNKGRASRGERELGGDSLQKTREVAIAYAESQAVREASNAEHRRAQDEKESAAKAEEEARKEKNRGLSVGERKANAVLDKLSLLPVNAGVGVGSRRQVMENAIAQDRFITKVDVFDSGAFKKDEDEQQRLWRAGYASFGNDQHPQKKRFDELTARLKDRGNYQKPEYRLYAGRDSDGGFYEITKTEYDYAQKLKSQSVEPAPIRNEFESAPIAKTPAASMASFEEGKAALRIIGDPAAIKERLEAVGIKSVPRKDGVSVLNKSLWSQAKAAVPVAIEQRRIDGVPARLADVALETMGDGSVVLRSPAEISRGDSVDDLVNRYRESYKDSPDSAIQSEMMEPVALAESFAPQHIENGQSETVTPAVIAASVQKSASNTPLDLKQAKAWLMNAIDAAIKEAPSYADQGIKLNSDKKPIFGGIMDMEERIGFKMFDVPGDGKFKIPNLKESLIGFRDRVEKGVNIKLAGSETSVKAKPFSESRMPVQQLKAPSERLGASASEGEIREMLLDGDYTAALEFSKQIGRPIVFGAGAEGKALIYTNARPFEVEGYEDFKMVTARQWKKSGGGDWAVIELSSGQTVKSGGSSQNEIDRLARIDLEKVTPEKMAAAVADKLQSGEGRNQETLEAAWVTWAEQQEEEADNKKVALKEAAKHELQRANEALDQEIKANSESRLDADGKLTDSGWHGAGVGRGGRHERARQIILPDGTDIEARSVESAGRYDEAYIRINGREVWSVRESYDPVEEKADAYLQAKYPEHFVNKMEYPFQSGDKWYNAAGTDELPENWIGVAQAKGGRFFLLGQDGGERSFTALTAKTYQGAVSEAQAEAGDFNDKRNAEPKKINVTPQVPSGDMEKYIKVAADSIEQLRKVDVYRVLVESNRAEYRQAIANYIKSKRPDLVAEVDSVLEGEKPVSAAPAKPVVPNGMGIFVDRITGEEVNLSDAQRDFLKKASEQEKSAIDAGKLVGKFKIFGFDGSVFLAITQPNNDKWNVAKFEDDGRLTGAKEGRHNALMGFAFDDRRVDVVQKKVFDQAQAQSAKIAADSQAIADEEASPTWYNYNGVNSAFPRSLVKKDGRWYRIGSDDKLLLIGRRSGDGALLDALSNGYRDWVPSKKVDVSQDGRVLFDYSTVDAEKEPAAQVRSPDSINVLRAPVEHGDVIKLANGEEWTAKNGYTGMGWSLVKDGKTHPMATNMDGQAAFLQGILAADSAETVSDESIPVMSEADARKLMEWRDLGQRDGTKTHALYFYASPSDFSERRGGMQYGEVESYQGGRWMLDGDILPALKDAKQAAVAKAVARLKRDGYVVQDAEGNAASRDIEALAKRSVTWLRQAGGDQIPARDAIKALVMKRQQIVDDKDNWTPRDDKGHPLHGVWLYNADARKKLDDTAWAITNLMDHIKRNGDQLPEVPEVRQEADSVPISSVIDAVNAKNGEGLTEADRVPDAVERAEQSMAPNWDSFADFWNGLLEGKSTIDDVKESFATVLDRADEFKASISKLKNDQLKRMIGYARPDDKKSDLVDKVYDRTLGRFTLNKDIPSMRWSYGESMQKAQRDHNEKIRAIVNSLTSDDLAEFLSDIEESKQAKQKQIEDQAEAISDPKTLEEFRLYMRVKMGEGMTYTAARMELTPEQRAEFDDLLATDSRSKRQSVAEQSKVVAKAPGEALAASEIIKTIHTKHGHDLWQFTLDGRMPPDEFKAMVAQAKRMGGDYSSYRGNGAVPGWQFRTEEAAVAFRALVAGDASAANEVLQDRRDAYADDRSQSAVERLTEMADRLEERADASLGQERKANTARRARFAASAEAAASQDKALARTMRNIAEAIIHKTAKMLDRVRQKSQVEMLRTAINGAKYKELTTKYTSYANQEQHKGEPATTETADYAQWPTFSANRSDLARLGREMLQIDGAKKLGQQLLKVADDVTKEYQKFAKDNLSKVSVFSAKNGVDDKSHMAVFSTADAAEAAIARSGYKGKATTISFKRGEHLVIMGPEMARESGLWDGDGDKRINLSADFGEEIVAKNKALGKRNRLSMPYLFDSVSRDLARWKALGIETPAEMRSALREFVRLQESPAEADKIKQMERAMVGRRNDGLDFFPTPAGTAQAMIDAAEIEPGMSVLEPSAGMGHIAEQIREAGVDPDVVEFSGDRRELLEAKGFRVVGNDFMDMEPRDFTFGDVFKDKGGVLGVMRGSGGLGSNRVGFIPEGKDSRSAEWRDRDELEGVEKRAGDSGYDRIIMNPPFSDRRDAQHVQHAYSLLKPGGRLVAIMGEGVFFGQDKKAVAFREWIDEVGGTSEKLDEGTFLDPSLPVNTAVNARMVVIDRPVSDSPKAAEKEDAPAVLSRGLSGNNPAPVAGLINVPTAKSTIARLTATLVTKPSTSVVQSFNDLPSEVQEQARNQDADERNTKGMFHNGTLYVVAGNHSTMEDLEQTIFHELYGHFGMRQLLGPNFIQKMNGIFASMGGIEGMSLIAQKAGFGPQYAEYIRGLAGARQENPALYTDKIVKFVLAEEIFAHIAEKDGTLAQKLREFIGMVRDWLRSHGFAELAKMNDADVAYLLVRAKKNLAGGPGGPRGGVTVPGVLSKSDAAANDADPFDLDFAAEVATELSFEDKAFRYPISKSKTLRGNMESAKNDIEYLSDEVDEYELADKKAEHRFTFAAPSGKIFYVYAKGDEVWIDVSRLLPGDGGGAVYHAVANYAHNTGKTFVGDPQGLTEDSIIRRTAAMLSSALRFGTTDHFAPANEQLKGVPEKGIEPLVWRGNDMDKTKSLIHTYVKTLQNNFPSIKNYHYDFYNREFRDNAGRRIGRERFDAGAALGAGRASRAGEASLRRGIFLQSIASSESSERPGILEQFVNGRIQPSEENQLIAVFRRTPSELSRDARQYLNDTFAGDTAKTFNWWHRHVGSQMHKAKIDRDFGRVFNHAQSFIDDVARYGTESSDLAPGLLPKMDTMMSAAREFWHARRDNADSKAIAAPIFDGTLFEDDDSGVKGKVWTDAELRSIYQLNDRQIDLYRQFRAAVDHSLEAMAIAEMNKVARVNELAAPESNRTLSMDELSDFYSQQYAGRLDELRARYAEKGKSYEATEKLMRDNASDRLHVSYAKYHETMTNLQAEHAAEQAAMSREIESLEVLDKAFKDKAATIRKLQKEGYAPLMRFGKYTVDVVESVPALDDSGDQIIDKETGEMVMEEKRIFFSMFESEREAREAERIMAEEYPNAQVSRGVASEEGWQLFGAVNPGSLEMLAKLVGKDDEVVQRFYKEAVAGRSAMKRLIHRQGIAGYSTDVSRSLASFLMSNARAAASSDHFGDMMEAAADIPNGKGDVKDEAVALINYIRNPNEEAGSLRGLLFMQFLGGSIAAAAVNLTQTMTTTMPYMHQFGGSVADLVKAAGMASQRMRGKVTDMGAELSKALTKAEEEGVVSPHNIHALMGATGGQMLSQNRFIRMASHAWGSLFGMAEQFNRETAFIAAFNRALELGDKGLRDAYQKQSDLNAGRGVPPPDRAVFASPYAFAKNAVNETQFILSKAARPNWARGSVGATLFTFKQFSVMYLELMKRLPNKERAIMLGTLIVLSGMGGIPGADDLDDLVDTMGQMLGYNTNVKKWKDRAAVDVFGKMGGDFVMSGVSAFLPLELSNRLGMGNLVPMSGALKRSNSGQHEKEIMELMGPAGGYFKQLTDAWDYTLQGRYGMAAAQGFLPKALKDASKAIDMASTGTYDDTHGRRVTDASTLDALVKAIGFQPSSVAGVQRVKGQEMQDIALVKLVKSSIAEIWAVGIRDRDAAKTARAREMIAEWNSKNPESTITIPTGSVMRRVKQMNMTAQDRMERTAPKEMRAGVKAAFAE